MSQSPTNDDRELDRLIDRMCDQIASVDELAALGKRLLEDGQAREHYIACLETHARLAWQMMPGKPFSPEELLCYTEVERPNRPGNQQAAINNQQSAIPPIVLDSSPTLHSPVGGFLFSYSMSALLVGIVLLIGWAWRVSNDQQFTPNVGIANRQNAQLPPVGRITGMVDCRWAEWSAASGRWSAASRPETHNRQLAVQLGAKYAVTSGFMEITYDTGAKVILQGPATYEVESQTGGFLSLGKLTARVESRGSRAESGEKSARHESGPRLSTLNPGLFSVRTPNALVTDLGTEFGVEVEKSGATRSRVFRGKVELRWTNGRELTAPGKMPESRAIQLEKDESATVEADRNGAIQMLRGTDQPLATTFIRQMPSSVAGTRRVPSLGAPRSTLRSPLYRIADLGTLGGTMSRANAMNDAGQVVGESATASGATHAFLYTDGRMKDLGTLNGGISCAYGINARGQVVGGSGASRTSLLPFLYSGGTMKGLGTLGGQSGFASAINDAGQVVGAAMDSRGVNRAFLCSNGLGMKDLGGLGGPKAKSWAVGINAVGMVAGYSEIRSGLMHAFIYSAAAGVKDLGTPSGRQSRAFRLNDAGRVIGVFAIGNGVERAFVYDNDTTGMQDIGTLGGPASYACDVNNAGHVVGIADCRGNGAASTRSFFYNGEKMLGLDSLLESSLGWSNITATAINDAGQIAGTGRAPDGNTHAFILTPIVVQAASPHWKTTTEPLAPQGGETK